MTHNTEDQSNSVQTTQGAVTQLTNFLITVIAAPLNQISGMTSEYLSYFRYKNLLSIRDKVEAIHKERSSQGKTNPLPPKFAIPIIEAASLEDEEPLQNLWAKLIASATEPNNEQKIHPAFADIIKTLSTDEAIILTHFPSLPEFPIIAESIIQSSVALGFIGIGTVSNLDSLYLEFEAWCRTLDLIKPEESGTYLNNLQRLGLVEINFHLHQRLQDNHTRVRPGRHGISESIDFESSRTDFVRVTKFCEKLLDSCVK